MPRRVLHLTSSFLMFSRCLGLDHSFDALDLDLLGCRGLRALQGSLNRLPLGSVRLGNRGAFNAFSIGLSLFDVTSEAH